MLGAAAVEDTAAGFGFTAAAAPAPSSATAWPGFTTSPALICEQKKVQIKSRRKEGTYG